MILIVDDTYLSLDKVNSIILRYEENKKIISNVKLWNPFTWFTLPTVTTDPMFLLVMDYTRGDRNWQYTEKHTDHIRLRAKFKKIVEQLKMQVDVQNQEMLDRLFETALTSGDTK